jgi:hypothetical protein
MTAKNYWEIYSLNSDKVIRIHSPQGKPLMELSYDGGETYQFACDFRKATDAARTAEMLIAFLGCEKIVGH